MKNYITSGFRDFDSKIGGFAKGELTLIGGRPGIGKTTLGMSIAIRATYSSAYFSLELTKEQLKKRKKIPKTVFVLDVIGYSLEDFCDKCRLLKKQKNIQLIIIDYIQLLAKEENLPATCRHLKNLSQELDVAIILLSQLSKKCDTGGCFIYPDFDRDVDNILFLYRDDYYHSNSENKNLTEIIVARHDNAFKKSVFVQTDFENRQKIKKTLEDVECFLKYIRDPKNEFGFFVSPIPKRFSTLPANIYVDDCGIWKDWFAGKIILFQTNKNYKCDFNKVLPMSIESEPKILVTNEKINLTRSEIAEIKRFVVECKEELLFYASWAREDFLHVEFFEALREKGFYIK